MNSSQIKIIGLIFVIVVFLFIAFFRMGEPIDAQPGPSDYHFICPQDGTTLSWTADEYRKFYTNNYGQDVPCPDKGTPMVRAERCPHCNTYFPRERYIEHCPECGGLIHYPPEEESP